MWTGVKLEWQAGASSCQSCRGARALICAASWHWKDMTSKGEDSMALPQEPRFEESGTNRQAGNETWGPSTCSTGLVHWA